MLAKLKEDQKVEEKVYKSKVKKPSLIKKKKDGEGKRRSPSPIQEKPLIIETSVRDINEESSFIALIKQQQ